MKVIIFGATGMVGRGALNQCIIDNRVRSVLSIGRTPVGLINEKFAELTRSDLFSYEGLESVLSTHDACFFCLGMPSNGVSEEAYTRTTYDLTLAAANKLSQLNPKMVFIYVSGVGADSTEKSSTMWARVRGRTENASLKLPFRDVYILRPAVIEPIGGVESKVKTYKFFYLLMKPLMPLLRVLFPKSVSSTENIAKAMITLVQKPEAEKILTSADFNRIAESKK